MDSVTPRCVRGPYRQKRRTPRQTKHNRTKRKVFEIQQQTDAEFPPDECENECPMDEANEQQEGCSSPSTSSTCIDRPTIPEAEDVANQSENQSGKVYENSRLSTKSSELALRSFSARHHLTEQAQDDLLQLLDIHLPKPNSIPSSVYILEKNSILKPISVEAETHLICPLCCSSIPDESVTKCPNSSCNYDSSTSAEKTLSFYCVSIKEQLKCILTSESIHYTR